MNGRQLAGYLPDTKGACARRAALPTRIVCCTYCTLDNQVGLDSIGKHSEPGTTRPRPVFLAGAGYIRKPQEWDCPPPPDLDGCASLAPRVLEAKPNVARIAGGGAAERREKPALFSQRWPTWLRFSSGWGRRVRAGLLFLTPTDSVKITSGRLLAQKASALSRREIGVELRSPGAERSMGYVSHRSSQEDRVVACAVAPKRSALLSVFSGGVENKTRH